MDPLDLLWTLLWTLSSLTGLVAATAGLMLSLRDRAALQELHRNGVLRILVLQRSWRNLVCIYIHGVFAVVGVLALAAPVHAPASTLAVLFTVANIALTSVNLTELRDRSRINQLLK